MTGLETVSDHVDENTGFFPNHDRIVADWHVLEKRLDAELATLAEAAERTIAEVWQRPEEFDEAVYDAMEEIVLESPSEESAAEESEEEAAPEDEFGPAVEVVLEEEATSDRATQHEVVSEPAAEIVAYVAPVEPLRGCREAQKNARPHVLEDRLVALRRGMVRLVQHDVVEVARVESLKPPGMPALNGTEQVTVPGRCVPAHQQVAEPLVPQYLAKGRERLPQYLFPVCDEEQRRVSGGTAGTPGAAVVVEGRDHGLSGAGRRDDEVTVDAGPSLGLDVVQDLLLEAVGAQFEEGEGGVGSRCRGVLPLALDGAAEPFEIAPS
jgi:hypothetical protein